jgi:flagellar hook-length control protein FliK
MTLDLTMTNLFSNPGGSGGAIALPASGERGSVQGVASVEAGASPFALMVSANQTQRIAALAGVPAATAPAQTAPFSSAPGTSASGASASGAPAVGSIPAVPVREAALASTSPLAMDATAPVVLPSTSGGDVELGDDLVIPVTPVAPVAPVGTKPARPVQNVIDAANSSGNATTGSPTADTTLSPATPATATPIATPMAATPSGPQAPVAPAQTQQAQATPTQATPTQATPTQAISTPPAAIAPVATAAANLAAPKQAEPRLDAGKPVAGKATAATAASASSSAATNTARPAGTAATPTAATAPAAQTPAPTTDGTVSEPLRQRGQAEAAIQTASSLAARPGGQANGAPTGQAGNPAQPGAASSSTAPSSAGMPSADPAAALAASKTAPAPAAQTGAPITPLPALMVEGQAQAAAMADAAQAEAALQAETDFNLSRADGRLAADRPGNPLPRFTPHSATQLAGQITKQVSNGNRVFDIRLDPAELGKVDVRIELRADNRVHAVLTVERPETLNELQRSARDLERALAEAGLELGEDGLSFQMNDGQNPADDEGRSQGEALPIFTQTTEMAQRAEDELASRPRSAYGFLLSGRSGVDVQV